MHTDPLAQIAASPAGPKVGAFFDLDGTLVSGFTATAHAGDRFRRGQSSIGEVLGLIEASVRYRLGRMQFERLLDRAAGYLRGESLAELDEVGVGATTPARVSVVTSEAFLNPDLPPANAAAFAQAQEYVVRDPVHVLWPEIFQRVYTPKMDLLFGGTADAASVAQQIADEANPLFARTE